MCRAEIVYTEPGDNDSENAAAEEDVAAAPAPDAEPAAAAAPMSDAERRRIIEEAMDIIDQNQ